MKAPKSPKNPLYPLESPNLRLENASAATKVRHATAINKTIVGMPLGAKRVLYLMLAQFDPKRPLGRDTVFTVHADEYANLCNIGHKEATAQLRAAATELQRQLIEIPKGDLLPLIPRADDLGDLADQVRHGKAIAVAEPLHRMFNVTQWVDYSYGSGYIEICPTRQMEPYIAALHGDYTTQTLLSALRLSNRNSANLYQFLRQAISTKRHPEHIDITIDDLKDQMGLYKIRYNHKDYRYPKFPDFKHNVLKPALRSINASTELDVSMTVVRKIARRAHTLRFEYTESRQHALPI